MTDETYSVAIAFIAIAYTGFLLYIRMFPSAIVHKYKAGMSGRKTIEKFTSTRKLIFYTALTLACIINAIFAIHNNKRNAVPILFLSFGMTFVICVATFIVLYLGPYGRGRKNS